MPSPVPLGSELWFLFFDQATNAYVPRCVGKVTRIQGGKYFAGGSWHAPAFPHFGSKADADACIAEHPFQTPAIK